MDEILQQAAACGISDKCVSNGSDRYRTHQGQDSTSQDALISKEKQEDSNEISGSRTQHQWPDAAHLDDTVVDKGESREIRQDDIDFTLIEPREVVHHLSSKVERPGKPNPVTFCCILPFLADRSRPHLVRRGDTIGYVSAGI